MFCARDHRNCVTKYKIRERRVRAFRFAYNQFSTSNWIPIGSACVNRQFVVYFRMFVPTVTSDKWHIHEYLPQHMVHSQCVNSHWTEPSGNCCSIAIIHIPVVKLFGGSNLCNTSKCHKEMVLRSQCLIIKTLLCLTFLVWLVR